MRYMAILWPSIPLDLPYLTPASPLRGWCHSL